MLARRQEINTQLQQILDAFLLALTLFATHFVRYHSPEWFGVQKTIDPFSNYHWLIVVVMTFGPILLDLQGFYESPLTKEKWKSFTQILQAMVLPYSRGRYLCDFPPAPAGQPLGADILHSLSPSQP